MSERGVFAVDRGVWEHPIFASEPYTEREAWMWMCGQAAWKDTRVRVGRTWISLQRRQLAFATRFLAQKWRWSDGRVRRFLNRLRCDAMVLLSPTRDATIITICNYDKYAFGRRADVAETDARERHEVTRSRRKEEESKNSKKEEKNIGAVASATRPNASRLFDEEFWKVYPRRDGANPKSPARKAFLTAVKSGHDPTAIIEGAKRCAAALVKANQIGTRYVPQAVTWLHQARWEDYPAPTTEPTGPPRPPDPSLPSHEELQRRYGGQSAKPNGSTEHEDHGGDLRSAGVGVCAQGWNGHAKPADNPSRDARIPGLGKILPGSSWLPTLGAEGGGERVHSEDDGPGTVA